MSVSAVSRECAASLKSEPEALQRKMEERGIIIKIMDDTTGSRACLYTHRAGLRVVSRQVGKQGYSSSSGLAHKF